MPNTKPTPDSTIILQKIIEEAKRVNLCNILPYASVTKGEKGEELVDLEAMKAAGAVLVAAIASVIVAFDILYKPEILRYIWLCILTYPSFAIKLSISAIVCLLFVVIDPKYYINPIKKLFSKKNKGN